MNTQNTILHKKKQRGRPKLSSDNLRSASLNIALTNREVKYLKTQSALLKLPLATYIREASLKKEIIVFSPDFLNEIKYFNRIGNNLNQILKELPYIKSPEYSAAFLDLKEMTGHIRLLLNNYATEVRK